MEERKIILNQISTPDGTILRSMSTHDYATHVDKNGLEYMVDGGSSYLRRNVHETKLTFFTKSLIKIKSWFGIKWQDPLKYTELTVYFDSPFEVIRESFYRGGRGKDGTQPLTWVAMCNMSDSWLKACISYNIERGMAKSYANKMYKAELKYRKANNIKIKE